MSKNMIRKSLAVTATGLLASAGFAALPASAAETLTLAPSSGTLYTGLTTSSFEMEAGFAGTESEAAAGTLKFRVVNAGEVSLAVQVTSGSDTTEEAYTYADSGNSNDLNSNLIAQDDFVAKTTLAGGPNIGETQKLSLEPQAHTADVTVTVQAFLDLNGDNSIDSNEATSQVRTITFYDQANMSLGTLTYESIALGSNSVVVSATTSPALNYSQVDDGDFDVQGLVAGSDSGSSADLDYDSTYKHLRSTVTLGENVSASKSVGMQVELTNGAADADLGDPTYNNVASGKATAISAVTANAGSYVNSNTNLRAGSGTVTVKATVTVASTSSKVQPVTFVFEEKNVNTLNTGATLTAGGKTLKNTSSSTKQKISVTVNSVEKTSTTGVATLTFSYAGLKAGDDIDVRAQATGSASVFTSGSDLAFVGVDSTVSALVDNVSGALRVVKGNNVSIGYTVVDQFGLTPAAAEGEFRVVVTEASSDANYTDTVAVSDGTATFTAVENSNANNDYVVTGTLQEKTVGSSTWGAIAGGAITETTDVSAVSAKTATTVSISAADDGIADGSAVALSLFDQQSSSDSEITNGSVSYDNFAGTNLTGAVSDKNGAPMDGASVTFSATDLQFVYSKADAGKVYGADSITVTTDSAGNYSVLVSSNQSGKQTITATSGGATNTEVVEFAAAATSTGADWVVTAPSYAQPGQTFKVTAKLVDKYGNPVGVDTGSATDTENIITTYDGPGIVFGTLPDETSATGVLSFSVLLGANDTGSATMTFGYSLNADSDATDYGEKLATATVTVGTEPAAQKVNAGSFKGYVAVYARGYEGQRLSAKIGNDWVIVDPIVNNQENGTLHRTVDLVGAGVDITVRIYIDRALTATIPLTTK